MLGAGYESKTVLDYLEQAMREYEAAAELAAGDDPDAVLRWNTCVRIIERNALESDVDEPGYDLDAFDDEVPVR